MPGRVRMKTAREALRSSDALLPRNPQVHWDKQCLGQERLMGIYYRHLLLLSMGSVCLFCTCRLFTVHCLRQSVLSLS